MGHVHGHNAKRMHETVGPLEQARRRAEAAGTLVDLMNTSFGTAGVSWPEELYREAWTTWRARPRYRADGRGSPAAREAIAAFEREENGTDADAEDVIITAGSSISYHLLFTFYRRLTGSTEVAFPLPGYPLFHGILSPLGMSARWYHCRPEHGFLPDLEEIGRLLNGETGGADRSDSGTDGSARNHRPDHVHVGTPRRPPAALVLITPNNPAGVTYPPSRVDEIVNMCSAAGVPVVIDEVFSLFRDEVAARAVPADSVPSGFAAAPHPGNNRRDAAYPVAHLNGLSKLCAAPEIKLGWITLTGGTREARRETLEALDTLHDTYLTTSGFAEAAARVFLRDPRAKQARVDLRHTVERRRAALVELFASRPHWTPHGASSGIHIPVAMDPVYAAQRFGTLDDETIAVRLVKEAGIHLHPGYFYELDHPHFAGGPWFIASALASPEAMERVIDRL